MYWKIEKSINLMHYIFGKNSLVFFGIKRSVLYNVHTRPSLWPSGIGSRLGRNRL